MMGLTYEVNSAPVAWLVAYCGVQLFSALAPGDEIYIPRYAGLSSLAAETVNANKIPSCVCGLRYLAIGVSEDHEAISQL